MNKALIQWSWRARSRQLARQGLHNGQRGQSLIIIVLAFIAILAMIGLGVDLGVVYVERVRLQRAADAAVLAAVSELPFEQAAQARALDFLAENGYDANDVADVAVVINPGAVDQQVTDNTTGFFTTTIEVDTAFARDPMAPPGPGPQGLNTADRVRVRIVKWVPMTFLQFVGWSRLPVEWTAEAENISNLDVVIVYDRSGSMEYDTLCYGCWDPPGFAGCSGSDGCIYPLRWSQDGPTATAQHCVTGTTYADFGNYEHTDEFYRYKFGDQDYYIIIEGEEYSSFALEADYAEWGHVQYKTFWVLQRNTYNYSEGTNVGSLGRDSRGGYISHHPWPSYLSTTGMGVGCTWSALNEPGGPYCRLDLPKGGPYPAPRVDYEFYAPVGGDYYFWVRGQGGRDNNERHIFWGVDDDLKGREDYFEVGANFDGARNASWDWERLGKGEGGDEGDAVSLSAGYHTLHLWGGGAGFDVDRVMITTDDVDYDAADDEDPDLPLKTAPANNARRGWACLPCDPRFAGLPGGFERADSWWLPDCSLGAHPDQREDDIYEGEQPIRDALDAADRFIRRMNFRLDQVGYVSYSTNSGIENKLECLRRRGPEDLDADDGSCGAPGQVDGCCFPDWSDPGDEPPRDPDCGCFSGVITDTVLFELNATTAGGTTNIAGGIKDGIQVLMTGGTQFGRPGAAHIMVLMTDGEANQVPDTVCDDVDLWPDTGDAGIDSAKDCVVYYAQQARNNGIVIYTISLGWSADTELMQFVADLTGGVHSEAKPVTPERLDDIFDDLFERIFVRLVE